MQVTIARNQKLFNIFCNFLSENIFLVQFFLLIVHMINIVPTLQSCPALQNIILYGLVLTRSSEMCYSMDFLPDTQNCGLRMRRECRERFPRHRLQRKRLVNDPDMHHGTCVTHVPWCMSGSLTRGGEENVPGIPGVFWVKVNHRPVYEITPHAPPSWAVIMGIFSETDMEAILNSLYEFYPATKLSPAVKGPDQHSV